MGRTGPLEGRGDIPEPLPGQPCPPRRCQERPCLSVARLPPARSSRAQPRRSEPNTCAPYGGRGLSGGPGPLTSPAGSHSSSTCWGLPASSFPTTLAGHPPTSRCGTQGFPPRVSPQSPLLSQEIKPESSLLSAGPGRERGPPALSFVPAGLSYPFILSTSEGGGGRPR